jgi:nitroreductase
MTMTAETSQRSGRPRERDRHEAEPVLDPGGLLAACSPGRLGPPGPHRVALTTDEVASVISVAARAPSLHNSQPWKFRFGRDHIDLLADPDRMLRALDPAGRELVISCGAALFGLRLGFRRLGRLPVVDCQPDPAQPWLLARVGMAGSTAPTRAESDMIAAVPHRHTHRGPFTPGEVPARLLATLATDALAEGCTLLLISDPAVISRLAVLVRGAAAEQRASTEITAELGRWVRPVDAPARDGVPAWARPAAAKGTAEQLAPRDFGLPGTENEGGAPPSATMMLLTPGDTKPDWLRAGQALDRVLLRAAARWVFARLQSQPLESPRIRAQVRALVGPGGYPQMLLQFGRANTAPATARRPHSELLA